VQENEPQLENPDGEKKKKREGWRKKKEEGKKIFTN